MKSKKLVVFAPSFYPHRGGVEKHLENTIKLLVERGYTVTVLVRYSRGFPKQQKVFGANVMRMPKALNSYTMRMWFFKNKDFFKGAIIHSHDFFPYALRKLMPDIRWVHTFHGYEGYPLSSDDIRSRQQVADQVDYTFCVGRFIEKWYGTKCDEVIYGAADHISIKTAEPKWDFIFYGRFEQDTGFENYIKAFKSIQLRSPEVTMLIVGNGSKIEWAKQYIEENKLSIALHDSVNDINKYLAKSRVAFVSGYLSIIECGLAKKPIIAYYGTPIKKDYLECHPMAKNFSIVGSEGGIYKTGTDALIHGGANVEKMYTWATSQTWDSLVNKYEISYMK